MKKFSDRTGAEYVGERIGELGFGNLGRRDGGSDLLWISIIMEKSKLRLHYGYSD